MTYYLTEPIELTQSGKLRGKSIRCFEATLKDGKYLPTCRMFSFKNGKLTSTPSYRKLSNLHTYGIQLDRVPSPWRPGLFSSPELALASKLKSFAQPHARILSKSDYLLAEYSQFAEQYPEIVL